MVGTVDQQIEDGISSVLDVVSSDWEHINYDPLLDEITRSLEVHHADHFALEHAPNDELWPALAPRTIAKKGHDRKLVEFADLLGSLVTDTTNSIRVRAADGNGAELIYGTSDHRSAIHQYGAPGANIPKREHVGMSELFTEDLEFVSTDFVVAALQVED